MDAFTELLGPVSPPSAGAAARPAVPDGAAGRGREITVTGMGAYEAADRFDQSTRLWAPAIRSADADLLPDKPDLDAKARDMLRNDAFVQGGANLHKDNIVGSQYLLNARPATRALFGKDDDVWEEEFQTECEEVFDLYAESPDNWVDASRQNNLTSLIRLGVGCHLYAGELLASVEWVDDDGGEFRTAVQIVDPDRLCNDPFRSAGDPNVRAGVRFNRRGAPIAYQVRTQHPADYPWTLAQVPFWKEIPARKPWGRVQMIHLFEQVRAQQSRGVAEMAAALKEMRMGHKWRDVNLQHAVTQALYAAAITSEMPTEAVFAALGQTTNPEEIEKAISDYASAYLGSIAQYAGNAKGLRVDGVRIPHLYPGTKLELLSPGKGGPLGTEFEQSILRYLAAALGVSYEQLSRDYTKTNYSSARAAMTETWKFMQARKKQVADRFATIIYRLWLEEAINNNRLSTFPAAKAPLLYTNNRLNLKFDAISRCDWIGASRGQIDEYKETQAAVLRIQNGLSTAEDELARLGKDWRKVYRQLKREQAMRDALGLIFTPSTTAIVATNDAADNEERAAA